MTRVPQYGLNSENNKKADKICTQVPPRDGLFSGAAFVVHTRIVHLIHCHLVLCGWVVYRSLFTHLNTSESQQPYHKDKSHPKSDPSTMSVFTAAKMIKPTKG